MKRISRRKFVKQAVSATAGVIGFPYIVKAAAVGAGEKASASNRITIGMIGVGSQALYANLKPLLRSNETQVVAVCDVDGWRLKQAKKKVEYYYGLMEESGTYKGCPTYKDFRDVLARDDIDAVMISTPDYWHVVMSIMAAKAGKDISCEKPLSMSVAEGRALCDAVEKYGCVFRIDSEFRSLGNFRRACELALNGRLGKIHTIYSGVPAMAHTCEPQPVQPVPEELDYDMWLGPAPWAPYTEKRVHARHYYADYANGSPGWMWVRDYCDGPICNWGTHLNDIVQLGNGTQRTGPVEVEGRGVYPKDGLWDILLDFEVRYKYANGVDLIYKAGEPFVRFEGTKGWVYTNYPKLELRAEPKSLLDEVIGPEEIHLPARQDKEDFIWCVKRCEETMEPAEVGHRTNTLCQIGHISIQLGRKLQWDPEAEKFVNDEQANKLLSRSIRSPWHL